MRSLLFYLFVVLLPWQTVWLLREVWVDGEKSQYATVGVSLSALVLTALLLSSWRVLVRWWHACAYKAGFVAFVVAFAVQGFFVSDVIIYLARVAVIFLGCGLIVIMHAERHSARLILTLLSVSMLGHVVLAYWQFVHQIVTPSTLLGIALHEPFAGGVSVIESGGGRWLRSYGGFAHPNVLGGVMAVMSVIALVGLLAFGRQRRMRIFFVGVGLCFVAAMVLAFSRAALVSYVLGSASIAVAAHIFFRPIRHIVTAALLMQLSVVAVMGVLLHEMVLVRTDATARLEARSLDERTRYVYEAWDLIQAQPLMGVGLGQYITQVRARDDAREPIWYYQPVHVSPLLLLAEMGVVGAVFACFAGILLLVRLHRRAVYDLGITLLLIAPLDVMIVSSFFDHWQWQSMFGVLFGSFLIGLVFVRYASRRCAV